jgi:hypothetical protein
MSKKFNVNDIINERKNELDSSPLFQSNPIDKTKNKAVTVPSKKTEPVVKTQQIRKPEDQSASARVEHQTYDTTIPRYHDTMQPLNHDTTVPQVDDVFDRVRKSVKQIGKEAATHRFTLDEKNHLGDIEYTYKRQGIRTSENEITRIAINYFIEDYRKHGESSLLAKVLQRLHS